LNDSQRPPGSYSIAQILRQKGPTESLTGRNQSETDQNGGKLLTEKQPRFGVKDGIDAG
jgi:hypothetical protein